MPVQIHFSAIYAKENSTTVLPSYYSARYLTIRVRNRGTRKFLFTRSNTPYFIARLKGHALPSYRGKPYTSVPFHAFKYALFYFTKFARLKGDALPSYRGKPEQCISLSVRSTALLQYTPSRRPIFKVRHVLYCNLTFMCFLISFSV